MLDQECEVEVLLIIWARWFQSINVDGLGYSKRSVLHILAKEGPAAMSAARESSCRSNNIPDNPIAEMVESWLTNLTKVEVGAIICRYVYDFHAEIAARHLGIGVTKYKTSIDQIRMYIQGRIDQSVS